MAEAVDEGERGLVFQRDAVAAAAHQRGNVGIRLIPVFSGQLDDAIPRRHRNRRALV